MQIRFIPYFIFHIYKSEKSGGWVGMVGGGGNIARGVKQRCTLYLVALVCLQDEPSENEPTYFKSNQIKSNQIKSNIFIGFKIQKQDCYQLHTNIHTVILNIQTANDLNMHYQYL